MKTKAIILAACAALLIPTITQAGDKGKKGKERMQAIDTNGDQVITREEAEAANAEKLLENFDKIDANGDGSITKEEMKAARENRGKGKKGKKGKKKKY